MNTAQDRSIRRVLGSPRNRSEGKPERDAVSMLFFFCFVAANLHSENQCECFPAVRVHAGRGCLLPLLCRGCMARGSWAMRCLAASNGVTSRLCRVLPSWAAFAKQSASSLLLVPLRVGIHCSRKRTPAACALGVALHDCHALDVGVAEELLVCRQNHGSTCAV